MAWISFSFFGREEARSFCSPISFARWNKVSGGKLRANSKKKKKQTIKGAVTKRDKNGDGKMSKDEYWQPGVFSKVDANGDGLATLEEIRAYY